MAYIARPLSAARMTSGQMRIGGLFHIRPQVKIQFFDRKIIKTRWRRFNRDPLAMAGLLVRKIARQSIKRRKLGGKPSTAGQPPRSRQPGATPPFKMIFSVPMNLWTAVVVGMVGFGNPNPAPGIHEHGHVAKRRVFTKIGQRRLKSGRYGKQVISYKPKMVKYPQRPFMFPALLRARSRLPQLWRGSFSRLGGSAA